MSQITSIHGRQILDSPVFANATPRDSQRSTWLIVAVHYPY